MSDNYQATFRWPHLDASDVIVTGTFDSWSSSRHLGRTPSGFFEGTVFVPWGEKVQYKYIVDGRWTTTDDRPTEMDNVGNLNNVFRAPARPEPVAPQVVPAPEPETETETESSTTDRSETETSSVGSAPAAAVSIPLKDEKPLVVQAAPETVETSAHAVESSIPAHAPEPALPAPEIPTNAALPPLEPTPAPADPAASAVIADEHATAPAPAAEEKPSTQPASSPEEQPAVPASAAAAAAPTPDSAPAQAAAPSSTPAPTKEKKMRFPSFSRSSKHSRVRSSADVPALPTEHGENEKAAHPSEGAGKKETAAGRFATAQQPRRRTSLFGKLKHAFQKSEASA